MISRGGIFLRAEYILVRMNIRTELNILARNASILPKVLVEVN